MVERRGFFKRMFGRRTTMSTTAVQVVIHEFALPDLRATLHNLIHEPWAEAGENTADARQRFFRRVGGLLEQCESYFEYGAYEYIPGEPDARDGFAEWVQDIEMALALEEEEIGLEVDGERRITSESGFVAVTLLALVRGPNPVAEEWDPDDDETWTKAAFADLLRGFASLPFEALEADAVYLVPGNDEDGLSEMDLADEDWAHLTILR